MTYGSRKLLPANRRPRREHDAVSSTGTLQASSGSKPVLVPLNYHVAAATAHAGNVPICLTSACTETVKKSVYGHFRISRERELLTVEAARDRGLTTYLIVDPEHFGEPFAAPYTLCKTKH